LDHVPKGSVRWRNPVPGEKKTDAGQTWNHFKHAGHHGLYGNQHNARRRLFFVRRGLGTFDAQEASVSPTKEVNECLGNMAW
jgi:hypothetical protein